MPNYLTAKELRDYLAQVDDDALIALSVKNDATAKRVILDSSKEVICITD
jgi:hypothetical protein